MKSILTIVFISFSLLYGQENDHEIHDNYVQKLNENAAKAEQRLTQNQAISASLGNLLLQGSVQRQNVKLAMSFYSDYAKSCIELDTNKKKLETPVSNEFARVLLCDQ